MHVLAQICVQLAYFVAKLLAGSFFAATFLLLTLGFQSASPDRDGGGGMAAMALAVFLLLAGVGVGLNVLVCGLLARSAARAQAVAEESCISRSAG